MGLPGGASLFLRAPLAASVSRHKIPQLLLFTERCFAEPAPALRTGVSRLGVLPVSGWSRRGFSVLKRKKGGVGVTAMDSSGSDGTTASQKTSNAPLSPASAIQFLTLIQRLKVRCGFFLNFGLVLRITICEAVEFSS